MISLSQTFSHVSYLANRVRMTSDVGDDLEDLGFDLAFPEFLWIVRDFQLVLEHNGRKITDDEYLENSLSTLNSGEKIINLEADFFTARFSLITITINL